MKRNWKDIKWMFEPDGALMDIYVQEVTINDWTKIIDLINEKYEVYYGDSSGYNESQKIDKKGVVKYLTDETGEKEMKTACVKLGEIRLNCHFFLEDQIEFDIDPKEINSIEDFEKIELFMSEISKVTEGQVTLTEENDVIFPLFKIDVKNRINKLLTKEEAKVYWMNLTDSANNLKLFKTKTEMTLIPNRDKEKMLKSAMEPYQSTKKDRNVW
ncbi:MAG: hypothetical protein ACI976_001909 [Aureispira sp.]|jgi:hypothetical protein